jgi:hypothetical protein
VDDRFQDILDSLPIKRTRSRLEPYNELIGELRLRGWTYRDIVSILAEKCQVRVSVSTVHDFVRGRTTRESPQRQPSATAKANANVVKARSPRVNALEERPLMDEVRRRITALKLPVALPKATPMQFQFDPNEPLHVPAKPRKG